MQQLFSNKVFIAAIDIPGAFIHDDIKDEINVKLEVTMAEMCANIDPQHFKYYFAMEN